MPPIGAAILYPVRADLADALRRLVHADVPLAGGVAMTTAPLDPAALLATGL